MKQIVCLASAAVLALALTACGAGSNSPAPTVTTLPASTSVSPPASSSSLARTTEETTEEASEDKSPVDLTPTQETAAVAQTPAGPGSGYRCLRTDSYTWDPSTCSFGAVDSAQEIADFQEQERLSQIPYANGGTCAAAICGYGTNSQGQRNPTSGEIQTLGGCQEGYITDPELCESVSWVENHQY